ncbi:hypothetical protein J2S54_001307 [Streptomyces sp. DSM 42143]|uniref:DUF5994 family protein n=1 Tax=Streptomyces TaxID=1883 RepID=UPI000BC91900|nr:MULTISPECIES: DUF5994 family protein [unclassified Streptomyces]MDN3244641.1 DUF5994 family protein [Streptomyces sp. ZSW22]MDN3252623.1 DUF5994 family protein [Streptomyces sp. MA25(2023)]MDQ0384487.1 hypothetical protein [Streptomyces sp. DSM 42143]PAK21848.1 hypothetical protein CJD44_39470 [Streptomyces sp. alain-838]
MTATVSPPLTTEDRRPTSPVRLSLVPEGSAPLLLDGAWWPRSRDLTAELPALASVLDPLWGRITRVTVHPAQWPVVPRKVPVAGHVVKVGWFRSEQDEHELLLLSYHVGRWNLLVVPSWMPPAEAAWLMTAASDPRRTATASRLVADAARPTVTAEADRTGEAVWESEGGHGAGALVVPARDRAVTEAPTERPERV